MARATETYHLLVLETGSLSSGAGQVLLKDGRENPFQASLLASGALQATFSVLWLSKATLTSTFFM